MVSRYGTKRTTIIQLRRYQRCQNGRENSRGIRNARVGSKINSCHLIGQKTKWKYVQCLQFLHPITGALGDHIVLRNVKSKIKLFLAFME